MKKSVALALMLGSGCFTGTVWAGSVTLPNTFTSGTPALASEVNGNFSAVKSAVDDNNTRLTTAEGTIASHSTAISTNAINLNTVDAKVTSNTTDISNLSSTVNSHTAAIANNTTNISNLSSTTSSNTAAIASKQTQLLASCASGYAIRVINADGSIVCQPDTNSGGDITGVIAGSGLSGGGASGDVTLSIPNGGITSSHIATGAVGTLAIASGAVASGNIAAGAVGTAAIADNSVTAVKIADEPGVEFTAAGSTNPVLNTCNTTTNLDSITVTAPASGYIYVSAAGDFCTYTGGVYSILVMDDNPATTYPNSDGGNSVYDYNNASRACGAGQFTPYVFQNVYSVAAGPHTYYLNGCVSAAGNMSYINRRPMIAMFFPTRY